MRLVLSRIATGRLHRISAHVQEHSPSAALKARQAILDTCTLLAEHPFAGRLHRRDVRVFVVPGFPYVIYYQVDEARDVLTVLTIRHTSQEGL